MNTRAESNDRDALTAAQRVLELLIVVAMLGLFGFLVYHQQTNTGFFTEKFGALEMLALYGPILVSLLAPAVRAWAGHRNPARPFEIATSLLLSLGSLWLFIGFPFSFAHLADTLPEALRFALAWVTDDIGKIPLALQIVVGPISAALTGWRYVAYRRRALTNAY